MSLARIALRIASVEALKGRTEVDDNVLDSKIGAIDVSADGTVRTDTEKPFVSVYTEGAKLQDGLDLRALHKNGPTELLFEIGIAASMTDIDPDTGEGIVIGIPATDDAFEVFLDCVARQIGVALSDPENEWAEVWRGLSTGIRLIERKRISDATSGVRMAAQQLWLTLDLIPDPVFGAEIAPTSIWRRFFDLLDRDEHPLREKLHQMVAGAAAVIEHGSERRRFGITLEEARALLDERAAV